VWRQITVRCWFSVFSPFVMSVERRRRQAGSAVDGSENRRVSGGSGGENLFGLLHDGGDGAASQWYRGGASSGVIGGENGRHRRYDRL
jgi:hypothetical protein